MDFYLLTTFIVLIMLAGIFYAGLIANKFHRRVLAFERIQNKTVARTILKVSFYFLLSTITILILAIIPLPDGTRLLIYPDDWLLMLSCVLVAPLVGISTLGPTLIILYYNRKENRKK